MDDIIKIAVDAMGGDGSPKKVIDGIIHHQKNEKKIFYQIFGDQEKIIKLGCLHPSSIVYADDCILNFIKNKNFFTVATCDKDLMRRVAKISETPVISIRKKKFNLIRY